MIVPAQFILRGKDMELEKTEKKGKKKEEKKKKKKEKKKKKKEKKEKKEKTNDRDRNGKRTYLPWKKPEAVASIGVSHQTLGSKLGGVSTLALPSASLPFPADGDDVVELIVPSKAENSLSRRPAGKALFRRKFSHYFVANQKCIGFQPVPPEDRSEMKMRGVLMARHQGKTS
eukprot:jgi/Bigna1/146398/aug1.114_g21106